MANIVRLRRQHRLDGVIEACGHVLTPARNGIRRGWHCDRHRNEFELTIFVNHGDDGYFICNRCGLRGDVVAWVGYRLFGDRYDRHDGHQLSEIAAFLEGSNLNSAEHSPMTRRRATTGTLPDLEWVAAAHRRLLSDPRCDAHRQYLAGRDIHVDDARRWQIGAFKIEVIIPAVEGGALRAVVKRRIDRKAYHVLGEGRNVLFNADALQDAGRVLICEAPFDAVLAARELPGWAVVSPIAGCRSWPDRCTDLIQAKAQVVIGYDNDDPGNDAALFLFRLFPFATRLQLPPGMDIGEAWEGGLDPFAQLANQP